jgi:nicotinamidase-related amidase
MIPRSDLVQIEALFDRLDDDSDGEISRRDLHRSARRLNWYWSEAPVYAVLDLLTIGGPLARDIFTARMVEIMDDPWGPYGRVLRHSPFLPDFGPVSRGPDSADGAENGSGGPADGSEGADCIEHLVSLLRETAGNGAADACRNTLRGLGADRSPILADEAALLVIDPQRSFIDGAWKESFGPGADREVGPIRLAFDNCARAIRALRGRVEMMFTRCPFPPDSYDFHTTVRDALAPDQYYFVKPGNPVTWPPTNGFREWLDLLTAKGKRHLVMGGCTMNSCVRVSSIEARELAADRNLRIVVDLSLSGARAGNYLPSPEFGGLSSAESAIREMSARGVAVVPRVDWR